MEKVEIERVTKNAISEAQMEMISRVLGTYLSEPLVELIMDEITVEFEMKEEE